MVVAVNDEVKAVTVLALNIVSAKDDFLPSCGGVVTRQLSL